MVKCFSYSRFSWYDVFFRIMLSPPKTNPPPPQFILALYTESIEINPKIGFILQIQSEIYCMGLRGVFYLYTLACGKFIIYDIISYVL